MDNSSYIMWKLVGGQDYAQGIFEDIIKSALLYRFRNFKKGKFPIDQFLTEAIFDLNSHDEVPLPMHNKSVNGQQLKELFITTIFARAMQTLKRYSGKVMFMTLPLRDEGADVGIFSVDSDGYSIDESGFITITKESEAAIFQVKEYLDYRQLKTEKIVVVKPLNLEFFHVEKLKTYNDEVILIYIRDARTFNTLDLREILKELKHKKIYVIMSFIADIPQDDGVVVRVQPNCYNFLIIDVWAEPHTVLHVWFAEPKSFKHIGSERK